MRTKRLAVIFTVLLCLNFLTGCSDAKVSGEGSESGSAMIMAYYTNEDATEIFDSERKIPYEKTDSDEVKMAAVIEMLNDTEKGKYSIIPRDVIEKISIRSDETTVPMENMAGLDVRVLQVELSDWYVSLDCSHKTVFRNCFSQTVFSASLADRIEYVYVGEDGSTLTTDVVSNQDRIYINKYGESFFNDHIPVTLYFMNESKDALVAEERIISLGMTEPLSVAIMKALIEGPKEEGHVATIPDGTKVTDIVLEKGVCYVDLNSEFQLNHEGTEQLEKLTIYSVVNSLASVRQINCVQFLINGEKVPYYKSYVQIDHVLEPDMGLVQEED